MNTAVRLASRKVGHKFEKEFGAPDPYYKKVKVPGKAGELQIQKIKRDIPEGLSPNDKHVLEAVRKRAYRLDMVFNILGFNLGYTAIIGFVPVIGAVLNFVMALKTVQLAAKVDNGLSNYTLGRMLANSAIDFLLTFIPFLGSSLNAIYKCNARNAVELDHLLRRRVHKEP